MQNRVNFAIVQKWAKQLTITKKLGQKGEVKLPGDARTSVLPSLAAEVRDIFTPPTSEAADLVGLERLTATHRRTAEILTKMHRSKRLIKEYVQVLCLHISGSIYLNLCATVQQICDPVLAGLRPFVHHLQSRSRIHGSGRRRYCRPAQLILHRHLLSNSAIRWFPSKETIMPV